MWNWSCLSSSCFSLHWLPIDSQIQYKLSSQCYNSLNSTTPGYLTELLKVYKPTCQLHSSHIFICCLPSVHSQSLDQRSFSYAVPSVWNSFPCKVRSSNTFTSFKSSLKSPLLIKLSNWLCVFMHLHAWACVGLFWLCFGSLRCNGLFAPIWRNSTQKSTSSVGWYTEGKQWQLYNNNNNNNKKPEAKQSVLKQD